MKGISNKDVAAEAAILVSLGFEYDGVNGNKHHRFRHPEHGTMTLPSTPSDWRWQANVRQQLAARMGLTKRQLEDELGIERRSAGRSRFRPRNESSRTSDIVRSALESVKPEPVVVGLPAPEERIKQIRGEIEEALIRSNLAVPGSVAYREALDDVAALRAEYCQLEVDTKEAA